MCEILPDSGRFWPIFDRLPPMHAAGPEIRPFDPKNDLRGIVKTLRGIVSTKTALRGIVKRLRGIAFAPGMGCAWPLDAPWDSKGQK